MQIYVEIERARLTKRLAKIEEAKGNVNEAADILQEVAVVNVCLERLDPAGCISWQQHVSSIIFCKFDWPAKFVGEQETFGAMAKEEKVAFILEQVIPVMNCGVDASPAASNSNRGERMFARKRSGEAAVCRCGSV